MGRIAYVNGRYVPHTEASVHIEDRGYQFADGVYEVCAIYRGRLLDADGHLERLGRSLNELKIDPPVGSAALWLIIQQIVRKNRLSNGIVYIQVTRGVATRDHNFPNAVVPASLIVSAKPVDLRALEQKASRGISVVTRPDIRWARCDIKSVGLLPNVLAKQAAREAGADDAWFVDAQGLVTEGASSNAWIVANDRTLITRPLDNAILGGITRQTTAQIAKSMGLKVQESAFSIDQALDASEAFSTSASGFVMPVVSINDRPIGDGRPGSTSLQLRAAYLQAAHAKY